MKLKIKLFAVAAFIAFAACAFLFSNNRSQAQTSKTDKRGDEILQKVAGYKDWKPLKKPDEVVDQPERIFDSTLAG